MFSIFYYFFPIFYTPGESVAFWLIFFCVIWMWIFGRKVAIHGLDYVIRQPNTLVFIMVIMYVISWGLIELSFLMAGGYDVRLYFFPFFSFSKRNNFSDRNVFMCSCVHVFMCVCLIFIYLFSFPIEMCSWLSLTFFFFSHFCWFFEH